MTIEEFQQLQGEVVRCHNKLREEEKARLELKIRLNQVDEKDGRNLKGRVFGEFIYLFILA